MESMLNELVKELYHMKGNRTLCAYLKNFDQEELQDILITPSKHKNLVK
jgi:hypothetical protein